MNSILPPIPEFLPGLDEDFPVHEHSIRAETEAYRLYSAFAPTFPTWEDEEWDEDLDNWITVGYKTFGEMKRAVKQYREAVKNWRPDGFIGHSPGQTTISGTFTHLDGLLVYTVEAVWDGEKWSPISSSYTVKK